MKKTFRLYVLILLAVISFGLIGCASSGEMPEDEIIDLQEITENTVVLSPPAEETSPVENSIFFTGYGSTVEEARSNARASLNAFFNGVLVESESSYQVRDDSVNGASYDVYLATGSSSRGYLKCVEYTKEKKQGNA